MGVPHHWPPFVLGVEMMEAGCVGMCGYVWVWVWEEQEQCLSHTDEYSGSYDCHMLNVRSRKVVT